MLDCKKCVLAEQKARPVNKEARHATQSRYYERHKEQIAEKNRQYRQTYPERRKAAQNKWLANNREKMQAIRRSYVSNNRQRNLASKTNYRRKHPEKWRTYRIQRTARENGAEGTLTPIDIKAQYDQQNGRCHWCGEPVGNQYHVDHVIPLSRGGTNYPSNIVIACPPCNLSRNNKLPDEWEGRSAAKTEGRYR